VLFVATSRRVPVSRMATGVCLAAAVGTVVLAGCGSGGAPSAASKPTVASLVQTMRADFRHAKSVRMAGHVREHGRKVTANLSLLRSGDVEGKMAVGGARLSIVRTGRNTYAYVSKSFFHYLRTVRHVPAGACALICGKYVKLPAGSLPEISLARLAKMIDKNVSVPKATPRLTVTTFAGKPAYEVSQAGEAAFFAKNGHHYLLGYRSSKEHVAITFSEWNSVPPIRPPPAGKIVSVG
jgi:outer membrane murein-binding lipoprotein Lpp